MKNVLIGFDCRVAKLKVTNVKAFFQNFDLY